MNGTAAESAAIDWMVRLTSGRVAAADHAAFMTWLAADPAHREAWQRLAGLVEAPVARLRAVERRAPGQLRAAHRALAGPASPRRRRLLGGAALLVLGAGIGGVVHQRVPLGADLRTGTAERRALRLADGSALTLNARSAVDVEFDAQARRLHLREGELVVEAAVDHRPFEVRTDHGWVTGQGQLLVRRDEDRCLAVALAGELDVIAADRRQRLRAGEGLWFGRGAAGAVAAGLAARAAWIDGLLDVQDEPLGAVAAALSRYRGGWLRVSPAAARLRVFGVFPLDDVDGALRALAEVLPIQVRSYGPWLASIDLR